MVSTLEVAFSIVGQTVTYQINGSVYLSHRSVEIQLHQV